MSGKQEEKKVDRVKEATDIYYILLDAYAPRPKGLAEFVSIFGYDKEEFVNNILQKITLLLKQNRTAYIRYYEDEMTDDEAYHLIENVTDVFWEELVKPFKEFKDLPIRENRIVTVSDMLYEFFDTVARTILDEIPPPAT